MVVVIGKRSNFERIERDFYPTPLAAVQPLIPHLYPHFNYCEPCAGDGSLIKHIKELTQDKNKCTQAFDIKPQHPDVDVGDILDMNLDDEIDYIITNPPWNRKILHPILEKVREFDCTTWLLFDADWAHTKQSIPYMDYCSKIVSVGRIKWIEGSKYTGKDNCCWYEFKPRVVLNTKFIKRT